MFEKIKAVKLLHRAGYQTEDARRTADKILSPENGEIILDHDFFKTAPAQIGTVLAEILPFSDAVKLTLSPEKQTQFSLPPALLSSVRKNLSQKSFSEKYQIPSLLAALKKSRITDLEVLHTSLENASYGALASCLPDSKIERLSFVRCDFYNALAGKNELGTAIGKSGIKRLELQECELNTEKSCLFIKSVGKAAKIEKINLSGNPLYARGSDWEKLFSFMPEKTTSLDFSNISFQDPDIVAAFAKGLKQMPQLTNLNLSCTGLESRNTAEFFDVLPQTNLLRLNLSGNRLWDNEAEKLAETLMNPACQIYETQFDKKLGSVKNSLVGSLQNPASAQACAKITAAEQHNFNKMTVIKEQTEARRTFIAVNEADKMDSAFIFQAAKAGKIQDVLNKKSLTPKEYAQTDSKGKTLIIHIAEAKQLDAVFCAQQWHNAQEMQKVWNMVPEQFKSQMDGKEGRQSYIKNKNEVMSKAVKTSLMQKGTQR